MGEALVRFADFQPPMRGGGEKGKGAAPRGRGKNRKCCIRKLAAINILLQINVIHEFADAFVSNSFRMRIAARLFALRRRKESRTSAQWTVPARARKMTRCSQDNQAEPLWAPPDTAPPIRCLSRAAFSSIRWRCAFSDRRPKRR
jgi:hypothetical protein